MKKIVKGLMFLFLAVFLSSSVVKAEDDLMDFEDFSLEDLLNITVTSAGGRAQNKNEVSNAMYVITSEDIARSGAKQLPDLFYKVPGMQVRRVNGHQYAVGIRGESSVLTNNLLLLIDGAVFFNPAFSGVVWEDLPIVMDEIDRIEIIRGPGGVLYSSNAVNGVINIITKKAKDGKNYVAAKGGTQDYREATIAAGVKGEKHAIRAAYQHDFNEGFNKKHSTGKYDNDAKRHVGLLRHEYEWNEDTKISSIFNYSHVNAVDESIISGGQNYKRTSGIYSFGNHFEHKVNDVYDFAVHLTHVDTMNSIYETDDANLHNSSASTQHNLSYDFYGKHVTSFGAEWRRNVTNVQTDLLRSRGLTQRVVSYFFQDEYRPFEKWIITGGVRIDQDTNVIDKETLSSPRVSVIYAPSDKHSFRMVTSRTYRNPSMTNRDLGMSYISALGIYTLYGVPDMEAERVWTYEGGYRGLFLDDKLSFNLDGYVSQMSDLIVFDDFTIANGAPYHNNGELQTYGIETDIRYSLSDNWAIYGDYTYIQSDQDPSYDSRYTQDRVTKVSNHMIGAGVQYTKNKFKVDLYAKYISKHHAVAASPTIPNIPAFAALRAAMIYPPNEVPGYIKTSLRMAYDFQLPCGKDAELELVASDFVDARSYENTKKYETEMEIYLGMKVWF